MHPNSEADSRADEKPEGLAIHRCPRDLSFKTVGNKEGKSNTKRERDGSRTIGRPYPVSMRRSVYGVKFRG